MTKSRLNWGLIWNFYDTVLTRSFKSKSPLSNNIICLTVLWVLVIIILTTLYLARFRLKPLVLAKPFSGSLTTPQLGHTSNMNVNNNLNYHYVSPFIQTKETYSWLWTAPTYQYLPSIYTTSWGYLKEVVRGTSKHYILAYAHIL